MVRFSPPYMYYATKRETVIELNRGVVPALLISLVYWILAVWAMLIVMSRISLDNDGPLSHLNFNLNWTRQPPELKHITKGRKRKQL